MHQSFPGASIPDERLLKVIPYVATPNRKKVVLTNESSGPCLALPNFRGGVTGCLSGLPPAQRYY